MEQALSPAPRRRNLLLIVSLCLNVALVPIIAAIVAHALNRDFSIGSGGILAPRSVMAAIPREHDKIQQVIDLHTASMRALRLESLRTRRQAFAVLAAPDYTQEKFATALREVHAADSALEGEAIAMMADSLATLTPQERRMMVDRVRARNRSWLFRYFRSRAAQQ